MNINEYMVKEARLIRALDGRNLRLAVLSRGDSFSWLTSGGNFQVSTASEYGPAILLIGKDRRILIAYTMDGRRILEEELPGLGFELVELRWFDESIQEKALHVIGNDSYISDAPLGSQPPDPGFFQMLHYPLTEAEQIRYRNLAKTAEQILFDVALQARPGMKESDIARQLNRYYADYGMSAPVMIIGSDERIARYRHCLPTDKTIEKVLLLAPAIRRHGLCVPISRMVSWGTPDHDLLKIYHALLVIEAGTLAACTPGTSFLKISETQKRLFRELGYEKEWELHFQGGLTGYIINDPTRCRDPHTFIEMGQAFNWYITISGAKVEETILVGERGPEIISQNGIWPLREIESNSKRFLLPDILIQ